MSNKYFPINSTTACKLKWAWSTVRLYNGHASSCHRVIGDPVDVENFNFHNLPHQLNGRKLMLEGKWPSGGCEFCKNIEEAGGLSDRLLHKSIPDQYPEDLDVNQNLINVNPKILEIYIDNICNLSCIYCWDGFSSRIQQENIKHGKFDINGVLIENRGTRHPQHTLLKEKFWQWMNDNSDSLENLNLLGGEPLYQKEFEKFLTLLESKAHTNLNFTVVSNLMIDQAKLKKSLNRIKNLIDRNLLKKFSITASIDCWGKEQEYVRYGLDLELWKQNFELLIENSWIDLSINQTLSGLTIKTIPEMITYINQFTDRNIGHYMNPTLRTYEFLHPKIFGKDFFAKDFNAILAVMKEETWQQKNAKQFLQGLIADLSKSDRDQNEINKLGVYLDELDRRRNLNWRQTFPWLEKEVQNVVS